MKYVELEKDPLLMFNICARCHRITSKLNMDYMNDHNDRNHNGKTGHYGIQYYLKKFKCGEDFD